MLEKDQAFCVRKIDYSDTSQIVTLFSEKNGKIEAIAKGSKKSKSSFGGPIELFSIGEIVFRPSQTGKLSTLTEFDQRPLFRKLQTRYYQLNCAMFAAELLNLFTQQFDTNVDLYKTAVAFLDDLQGSTDDASALLLLINFQLKFLQQIGLGLVFDACVNCGTKYSTDWSEVYFSNEANGLLCRDCEAGYFDKVMLSSPQMELLLNPKLERSCDARSLSSIEELLIKHFTCMHNKPLRMSRFFLKR